MNKQLKFLIISVVAVIAASVIAGLAFSGGASDSNGTPKLVLTETDYDFGTISMANGLARHEFKIKNEGNADLKLSNISTSCMCTTAVLIQNGKKSPTFGMHNNPTIWSEKIKPGEEAVLEVIFDPLAHGPDATGPVSRAITMYSNEGGNGQNTRTVLMISGNVVK
ncbi:DUF1573 domain-containing protein [Candidatus Parcubacteria bacterium]|nr:MAG: DUF1573 domain-containing protein [Candidatus Parcubacteria bacterium]